MTKGERIKELRIKYDMSQDELAKRLDTTKQTIYKYEHNIVTNIPTDKIEIMANIFHVTPEYICCWDIGAGQVWDEEAQRLIYYMRKFSPSAKNELMNYADYLSKKEGE